MQNGIVIQVIAREQDPGSSESTNVAGGELIELSNRTARVLNISGFEICLGQQVQTTRMIGMSLNLGRQLCNV